MQYDAKMEVSLIPDHSDPEGENATKLLKELSYVVKNVNVSKVYNIILEAQTLREAKAQTEEMCKRLLANPIKDNHKISIGEQE
jgi:phosphoribosylformylglycinamidine synthase PurS subunit